MIPERYRNFHSEISGKFPIGNFGKLPRPIPSCQRAENMQIASYTVYCFGSPNSSEKLHLTDCFAFCNFLSCWTLIVYLFSLTVEKTNIFQGLQLYATLHAQVIYMYTAV